MNDALTATRLPSPVLLLGAAHSGKSELALQYVAPDQHAVVIGTSRADGRGMGRRISELKALRPPPWESVDSGADLPAMIADAATGTTQILVDSVSQWLAGMTVAADSVAEDRLEEELRLASDELVRVIHDLEKKLRLVLVSAEVGAGPAPTRAAERLFRRAVGQLNRRLATLSRSVVVVHAGIPQRIK